MFKNKRQCLIFVIIFCVINIQNLYAASPAAISFDLQNQPTPSVNSALNALIARNILDRKYDDGLLIIDEQLQKDPKNVFLLYQKAAIYIEMEQYENAWDILNNIENIQKNHPSALYEGQLDPNNIFRLKNIVEKQIAEKPHNELGYDQDEAYVSDVGGYWTYSSLHYYRLTRYGNFGGRINFAKRNGTTGLQYVVEAYPRITKNIYATILVGYANHTQILYPQYQHIIEPYISLPHGIELSLGHRMIRSQGTKVYTYTTSIGKSIVGKMIGSNFAWFRLYHYTPKSTDFYEFGARHFFDNENNFISLKTGFGKAPDIGDLPPLNQIIILSTHTVSVDGQREIAKNVFLKVGLGYLRQVFQAGNIRDSTDISAGIFWQF
jgi:YaiO family outer membrane protein